MKKNQKYTIGDIWKAYEQKGYDDALQMAVDAAFQTGSIDYLHTAGLAMMALRRRSEGLTLLRAAATFLPNSPHIYINAAYVCEQAQLFDDVQFFVDNGLRLFPFDESLLNMRGNNQMMMLQVDAAINTYKDILSRNPAHVQSWINLGNVYRGRDEFAKAEAMFDKASALDANLSDIRYARATMYCTQGKDYEGINVLQPIAHEPDAQFLLGMIYMGLGDLERGFKLYQARFDSNLLAAHKMDNIQRFLKPLDHWKEAANKNIAIVQEGGFGDMIQFCRYIPTITPITTSLTYYVPKQLLRLMKANLSGVTFKTDYDGAFYDYVTTDFSLPYHFRTTQETIPAPVGYLSVPDHVVEQHRLPQVEKRRVGICWAGGKSGSLAERHYDGRRSIQLDMLSGLHHPDIEFISLQQGARNQDTGLAVRRVIKDDFDFLDTAAIIEQCDLVISVDTAVCHLAAALGKPTWILIRLDSDWRWTKGHTRSLWYPTVQLFRQEEYKNWQPVIDQLTLELHEWAS